MSRAGSIEAIRSTALVAAASMSFGCSNANAPAAPVYDTCFSVEDCVESATLCELLSVEFVGFEFTNAICTVQCSAAGPLSSDCPRAFIGRPGSCYPSSLSGGIDDTPVCFEPCGTDADCLVGFRCLTAVDLCGENLDTCPMPASDAICVPGPS